MKTEKRYCSKCNRCLTNEEGTSIIGLALRGSDNSPFMREQLGKYAPKTGDSVSFDFCWECWLDSLFR